MFWNQRPSNMGTCTLINWRRINAGPAREHRPKPTFSMEIREAKKLKRNCRELVEINLREKLQLMRAFSKCAIDVDRDTLITPPQQQTNWRIVSVI